MSQPTAPIDLRLKLPLRRDSLAHYLFDANGTMVAQIRGWGHLTGGGGLHLSEDEAIAIQTGRLDLIVRAVNSHTELIAALKALRDACARADSIEELSAKIDGSLIDAATAALARAEGRSV